MSVWLSCIFVDSQYTIMLVRVTQQKEQLSDGQRKVNYSIGFIISRVEWNIENGLKVRVLDVERYKRQRLLLITVGAT